MLVVIYQKIVKERSERERDDRTFIIGGSPGRYPHCPKALLKRSDSEDSMDGAFLETKRSAQKTVIL